MSFIREEFTEALRQLPRETDMVTGVLWDATRRYHINLYFLQIEFSIVKGLTFRRRLRGEHRHTQMLSTTRLVRLRHITLPFLRLAFGYDWTPPWGDVRTGKCYTGNVKVP